MHMLFGRKKLTIIGSTEYSTIAGIKKIPTKIDTGADSSAIWASNIRMGKDGILSFELFDKSSPLYTGERLQSSDYEAKLIRSSHGDEQIRYKVKLPLTIKNKTFQTAFTLANRSRNNFPVLIGRKALKGNFLVDVSKELVERPKAIATKNLNQELKKDPYTFHQKYLNNDTKGEK